MVKSGVMLPALRPSASKINPAPAPGTRDPLLASKVVVVEPVYSMAWIYQLLPVRPTPLDVALSFMVHCGAARVA